MWRKVLGLLWVGVFAACTQPLNRCDENTPCPEGSACQSNVCVGTGSVDNSACDGGCADYQVCLASTLTCGPKYEALTVTPADNSVVGGRPLTVNAELRLMRGYDAGFPEKLLLAVSPPAGAPTELTKLSEGGSYGAQWTPATEGEYQLKVAYPVEGGPSAQVKVRVDRTGPVLKVVLPTRSGGGSDGGTTDSGFIYADPEAPSAWRRDQTLALRIESSDTDVNPQSVSINVSGFDGGVSQPNLSVAQCDGGTGGGYCGTVNLDLWKPGLNAFRGEFAIEVKATDGVGNTGTGSERIPVTRWKWSFNGASGPIRSSPAIGKLGTVYFGTSESNGKVFALAPEGVEQWSAPSGPVQGSPAVGAYRSGAEPLYVGVNKSGGVLYAFDAKGNVLARCPGSGGGGVITTAITVLNTSLAGEQSPSETAVTLQGGALMALRPALTDVNSQCVSSPLNANALPGASIIAKGSDVYWGAQNSTSVLSYRFGDRGWVEKPGYSAPTIGAGVTGLGFTSDGKVFGAAGSPSPSSGGIFSFPDATGMGLKTYPDAFAGKKPVRNVSVGATGNAFFGQDVTSGGELNVVELATGVSRALVPNVGSFIGSPVLGASGLFYTASAIGSTAVTGGVTAWSVEGPKSIWKLTDTVGISEASPALDCSRGPAGIALSEPHGVLYVPSTDGKLYAFVVDSAGLDPSAPWPKYQHDSRNTGNPETPITSCP